MARQVSVKVAKEDEHQFHSGDWEAEDAGQPTLASEEEQVGEQVSLCLALLVEEALLKLGVKEGEEDEKEKQVLEQRVEGVAVVLVGHWSYQKTRMKYCR